MSVVPCCFSCCFLTYLQVSQEASKVFWYFLLFKNFPLFLVIHIVKGFSIVNSTEVDVFLESFCFFYDPVDVGNLMPGSSAFSQSSFTFGSSWFIYYWSLTRRIFLAWPCYHVRFVQLCGSLNIVWHWPPLVAEWKLTFSSPVATVEFYKFASILSEALQ